MRAEESYLLCAQVIVAHEGRADAHANLDENILAGPDGGDFLRDRTGGQHPVKERRERQTTGKWLHRVKVRMREAQRLAKAQQEVVAPDLRHEPGKQHLLQLKIGHRSDG